MNTIELSISEEGAHFLESHTRGDVCQAKPSGNVVSMTETMPSMAETMPSVAKLRDTHGVLRCTRGGGKFVPLRYI